MSSQDIVAGGYDAISERYAAWQAEIRDDPRDRWVQRLISLLPQHPDILEIGCGAGVEPTPTFARVGNLTGIDVSHAQVERARRAVPQAELIHGDATSAVFETGSFDAVVALYVLTHVPGSELPALLSHVATWLRHDGLFLATFGSGPSCETVVDDWLGAPMFFSELDEATNERLVAVAGLRILESAIETMQEPETEPGRGPKTVAFHWLLAQKAE